MIYATNNMVKQDYKSGEECNKDNIAHTINSVIMLDYKIKMQ